MLQDTLHSHSMQGTQWTAGPLHSPPLQQGVAVGDPVTRLFACLWVSEISMIIIIIRDHHHHHLHQHSDLWKLVWVQSVLSSTSASSPTTSFRTPPSSKTSSPSSSKISSASSRSSKNSLQPLSRSELFQNSTINNEPPQEKQAWAIVSEVIKIEKPQ